MPEGGLLCPYNAFVRTVRRLLLHCWAKGINLVVLLRQWASDFARAYCAALTGCCSLGWATMPWAYFGALAAAVCVLFCRSGRCRGGRCCGVFGRPLPTVKVCVLSIDTPETLKNRFMDQLSKYLLDNGYIMEHVDEHQAGAWTLVLHVPAQRLDVARITRALERAGVCGSMGGNTSVVTLMRHSHTCQGPPMVARAMTSDRCFDGLERSVRQCLDWYYPVDALRPRRLPCKLLARMDIRKILVFGRLNSWPLNELVIAVKEIQKQQATIPCPRSTLVSLPNADGAAEPRRGVIEDSEDPAAVVGLPSTSRGPSPSTTSKLSDSRSYQPANEQARLLPSSVTNVDKF